MQSSLLDELDKRFQQPVEGQHRHRYYSQSTEVPSTGTVMSTHGTFWAQRIITECVVFLKRGLCCECYGSDASYPLSYIGCGLWKGSGPVASRCLTVLSKELIG